MFRVMRDDKLQAVCTTLQEAVDRTADTTGISGEAIAEQWRKDRVLVDGDGTEWSLTEDDEGT